MTVASPPCVMLLAAGQSRRMGGDTPTDKLMLPITRHAIRRSLLEDRIATVLATGFDLFLLLPSEVEFPKRWAVARTMGVTPVACETAHLGIGESLATAFRKKSPPHKSTLIMLADMPELSANDLIKVANAGQPDQVWRGSSEEGQPGHPVRIPRRLYGEMRKLTGDRGAQSLWKQEKPGLVPLPGQNAVLDLDTPEDWRRYCTSDRVATS